MALTRQEARRLVFEEQRQERRRLTNNRKKHPCGPCTATGAIRRSWGLGVPDDPHSEAYAILPCGNCGGDGIAKATPFSRAATLDRWPSTLAFLEAEQRMYRAGIHPDPKSFRSSGMVEEFDAEDLDLEAIAERVGMSSAGELIEAARGVEE